MSVLRYLKDQYDYLDQELSDPRTKNRFLVPTPLPLFGVIAIYLCLVKYVIPVYMRNRDPLYLRRVILYYDLLQIFANSYIVYLAMECIYAVFLSRILEFLDTIFFALRKKDNHISFLHVFHHSTMAFNAWVGVKFSAGSSAVMVAIVNSSVHVIMYSYYLLSNLGPKWQKYLWWKRYLTIVQIIQLSYGLVGFLFVALTIDNCPELLKREFMFWYMFLYVFVMLCLFRNFYKKSYGKTTNKEQQENNHKTQ